MEQLGWARGQAVQQEKYPNKRVYEATPAGLAALREWLDAPSRTRRQRTQEEIVLKAFLGTHMTPQRLYGQLQEHREHAEEQRRSLAAVVEHLDAKGPVGPHRFARATARYGILQAEATIAWTKEVQALLDDAGADSPADP